MCSTCPSGSRPPRPSVISPLLRSACKRAKDSRGAPHVLVITVVNSRIFTVGRLLRRKKGTGKSPVTISLCLSFSQSRSLLLSVCLIYIHISVLVFKRQLHIQSIRPAYNMSLGLCTGVLWTAQRCHTPPLDQLSTHGYSAASAIPKTERRVFQTAVVSTRSSERRPFLSRDWCFLLRSIRALKIGPGGGLRTISST